MFSLKPLLFALLLSISLSSPVSTVQARTKGKYTKAQRLYRKAHNALKRGRYTRAIRLFRTLLRSKTLRLKHKAQRQKAHQYLALAYLRQGEHRARRTLLRYLRLHPKAHPTDLPPALTRLLKRSKTKRGKKRRSRKQGKRRKMRVLIWPWATLYKDDGTGESPVGRQGRLVRFALNAGPTPGKIWRLRAHNKQVKHKPFLRWIRVPEKGPVFVSTRSAKGPWRPLPSQTAGTGQRLPTLRALLRLKDATLKVRCRSKAVLRAQGLTVRKLSRGTNNLRIPWKWSRSLRKRLEIRIIGAGGNKVWFGKATFYPGRTTDLGTIQRKPSYP